MAGTEVQHAVDCGGTSCWRAGHRLLAQDQTECGHLEWFEDSSHIVEATVGRECIEEGRHVRWRVDRGNDQLKTPGKFLKRSILLRVVHVMSTQFSRFRL